MKLRSPLQQLTGEARACKLCAADLPLGPRPVFQVDSRARILIAGQAPGIKVHRSGIPFEDSSGDRLRDWMGVDRQIFYDPASVAILPVGFCYPGRGASGDRPPLAICADTWRRKFLALLPDIRLTLLVGRYAQRWHLPDTGKNLTRTVAAWRTFDQRLMPLPHPSPRNNVWLKRNPWFETDLLPALKRSVSAALAEQ